MKHAEMLLDRLKQFKDCSGLLCDILVRCEGESFPCHKAVLASSSKYFAALITESQYTSKEITCIDVQQSGISSEVLMVVIDFIYSGEVANSDNIELLYIGSIQLNIPSGIDYVKENVDIERYDLLREYSHLEIGIDVKVFEIQKLLCKLFPTDENQEITSSLQCNDNEEEYNDSNDNYELNCKHEKESNDSMINEDILQKELHKECKTEEDIETKASEDVINETINNEMDINDKSELDTCEINGDELHSDNEGSDSTKLNISTEKDNNGKSSVHLRSSKQIYNQYRGENGSYECPHCGFSSALYKAFFSHMEQHKDERKKFKCGKCNKEFRLSKNLKDHLSTHSDTRPFACDICSSTFKSAKHLLRHKKVHSGVKPYACTATGCEKKFLEKYQMQKHYKVVHLHNRPFKCPFDGCEYKGATKVRLQEHKQRKHMKDSNITKTVCDICGKELKGARSIDLHMAVHQEPGLQCPHCEYKSRFKGALKSHMMRCHGVDTEGHTASKQHMCLLCGFQSFYIYEYKLHMTKHQSEQHFKCDKCDFSTNRKTTFKIHSRSHTGERPFACVRCDKAYTSQSSLFRHVRSHTGDKPHKCQHCDASYTDKKNLVAHMHKHTGVKPFSCDQCTFSTVKKFNLKKHKKKMHSGDPVVTVKKQVKKRRAKSDKTTSGYGKPVVVIENNTPLLPTSHSVDLDTATAAAAMQSMASGVYLQHNKPDIYNDSQQMNKAVAHYNEDANLLSSTQGNYQLHTDKETMLNDKMKSNVASSGLEGNDMAETNILSVAMAELGPYPQIYSQQDIGIEDQGATVTISAVSDTVDGQPPTIVQTNDNTYYPQRVYDSSIQLANVQSSQATTQTHHYQPPTHHNNQQQQNPVCEVVVCPLTSNNMHTQVRNINPNQTVLHAITTLNNIIHSNTPVSYTSSTMLLPNNDLSGNKVSLPYSGSTDLPSNVQPSFVSLDNMAYMQAMQLSNTHRSVVTVSSCNNPVKDQSTMDHRETLRVRDTGLDLTLQEDYSDNPPQHGAVMEMQLYQQQQTR